MQGNQVLEDSGDFEQRSSAHAVGVFLEAVFPVAVAAGVAVGEVIQDFLDFAVANHPPQADASHIATGHHHFQAAGLDV